MLALQSAVMLDILDPETPGGFRLSMDCRCASSSATADDMVKLSRVYSIHKSWLWLVAMWWREATSKMSTVGC